MAKKVIFDKKNVLVAGGAGFIGSHLCDELIKTCKVVCVDNFISGSEKKIDHLLSNPDFVFINHDLKEPLDLLAIADLERFKIKFQGIQEVYNLACPMSPRSFLNNRLANIEANSVVVKNLLDLALANDAKFLHFSSSVIYGHRESDLDKRVKENDLMPVDNLSERASYDEGKRFAETIVKTYRDVFNIDAKIIRLFRTYGPRMELDDEQMIPEMFNSAINNKDVVIFGNQSFSSSFCYIDDVIDAASKIMSSNLSGPVNIGSDIDVNLTDLAQMVIDKLQSGSKIVYQDHHLFMSNLMLPDIFLARNELGWMPVVTLENGLEKTIFSFQANNRLQGFAG